MDTPPENRLNALLAKINSKEAKLAVIGLGYVGLPLAIAFGHRGFTVLGIEVDQRKVELVNSGQSYVRDVTSHRLQALAGTNLFATTDYSRLQDCDAAIICVPTPLGKTRDPDVGLLLQAGEKVAENLRPGMLICLESTTYPGTTEELILPMLEQKGLRVGKDFFLAFSPERIDPGRSDYTVENTPKVVGGLTPACLSAAASLYGQITQNVVIVSSTRAAEMVKLLENTFRAVNIALVNEVAIMCDKLGIEVGEVIEAAATKPFGFMRFNPGPGVGGHCIPLDPHYLSWKLKTVNYNARFIQLAGEVNSEMPRYWADKVQSALNESRKPLNGSRILVLGVAYKKDVNDVRESPALDVIELLRSKGADVRYHDPYVPAVSHNGFQLTSESDMGSALKEADCVVILTDHSSFDWEVIVRYSRCLVDTRNVLKQRPQVESAFPAAPQAELHLISSKIGLN